MQGSSLLIGDKNRSGMRQSWNRDAPFGLRSLIAFLAFYSVRYSIVTEALRPVAVGMVMTSEVAVGHLRVPKCILGVSRNNSEHLCNCGLHK